MKRITNKTDLWEIESFTNDRRVFLLRKSRIIFLATLILSVFVGLSIPYIWMGQLIKKDLLDIGRSRSQMLMDLHFQLSKALQTLPPLDNFGQAKDPNYPDISWIRFTEEDDNSVLSQLDEDVRYMIEALKDDPDRDENILLTRNEDRLESHYVRIFRATGYCLSCHGPQGTAEAFMLNKPIGVVLAKSRDLTSEILTTVFMNRLWIIFAGFMILVIIAVTFYITTKPAFFRLVRRSLLHNHSLPKLGSDDIDGRIMERSGANISKSESSDSYRNSFPTLSVATKNPLWNAAGYAGSLTITPGTQIDDYQIFGEIGRGGMGAVFKAQDISLDRIVALKVLYSSLACDLSVAKRFRQEAILAASLKHSNIVPVFFIDDHEPPRYYTMEFVRGMSLAESVDRNGILPPPDAVSIILEICEALRCVHLHNVLHRDIKPSNILLDKDIRRARLSDFGIARISTRELAAVTITEGLPPGTLGFMSPEHNLGEELDQRADIFSIGMTLYFTLTGRLAYRARNRAELAVAFLEQHPLRPSVINRNVSSKLDEVILKMIAIKRDERFASVDEVIAELSLFARNTFRSLGINFLSRIRKSDKYGRN